jgi:hypothetical protein
MLDLAPSKGAPARPEAVDSVITVGRAPGGKTLQRVSVPILTGRSRA